MPSQDKLIKQGIKYTDAVFDEITKRLDRGVKSSDTLEAFLDKYHKAFPKYKDNPIIALGYDAKMLDIILQETNNHKFSRPAQKELVRVTIENQVGENIRNVGEDIHESVRDIVKEGYNNNLSQDKIAENISNRVSAIKGKRARAIARTEIARTATISDYIINKERGATHFYVECRNTACPICKKNWLKNPDKDATGKGMMGDKTYSMNDTQMLPPVHPNCRCVPYFISENDGKPTEQSQEPTKEQLSTNLTPAERAKYANYKRSVDSHQKWLKENPDAPTKQIEGHRARLAKAQQGYNELRVKALGGTAKATPKPAPKPKAEPKPKPKKPKPETPKEPKKPKPEKEPTQTQTPTHEQLHNNLTKKELKEWTDHRAEIKWANEVLNNSSTTDKQKTYAQKRLDTILPRFNELTNKALGKAPKTKTSKSKSKRKSKSKSQKEEVQLDKPKNARLTKEEADSLTFNQLAEHHEAEYKGLILVENEGGGKEYHVFEQTFDNGETFKLHIEKGAVSAYNKGDVASANEIIHEVFKVPEVLRKETNQIFFKNTQQGVVVNSRGKLDTFKETKTAVTNGYNTTNRRKYKGKKINGKLIDDPDHKIVINPKFFKKLTKFKDIINWRNRGDQIATWKHAIHHEFTHSIDDSREIWKEDLKALSHRKEFVEISKEERYFTDYSNRDLGEEFAEHGGYISYMLANPEEHSKKITIHTVKDRKYVSEEIDFEEYKKRYPKHYKYFLELFGGEE